jgi:beta-glucuronidase
MLQALEPQGDGARALSTLARGSLERGPRARSYQVQLECALRPSASVRFGIREIRREGNKVLLNGEEVFLKGVCRYDEYAGYGNAPPEDLIRKDLQLIKDTGANLVRVHYPQAPIHYEIADEIGLFYMHDVPLCWWRPKAEEFLEHYWQLFNESMQAVDRMSALYYNHPSWAVWSMSNECNTYVPAGREMMARLMKRAREAGGNRLMTWVCDHRPPKGEFDGADLICVNLYYGLHHGGERADYVRQFGELVERPTREYLEKLAEDNPDMPVLVAEFGTVGVYGMHGNARLTEDFQAEFIKCTWDAIIVSANICGAVIWSWADYFHRKDFFGEGNHINTPFGPYGLVTADRKIKSRPYNMAKKMFANKMPK